MCIVGQIRIYGNEIDVTNQHYQQIRYYYGAMVPKHHILFIFSADYTMKDT